VMDVIKATSGSYLWMGQPGNETQRKQIGTLLETPNFYHYSSGERNLKIAATIKQRGEEDIPKVLETVNLFQRRHSKFSTYSLGMKQRLAIASALLGNPNILVFDEPTNGLDPAGIAEIRELIKDLSRQGKTIIMASHILDEVEKVCTHVAIIQKGDLKTVGSVSEVLSHSTDTAVVIELAAGNLDGLTQALQKLDMISEIRQLDNSLQIICSETVTPEWINQYCFEKGIVLNHLNMKRKNLETRFLEITGTKSSN
jgi:lantibiotic transport system ATP-binding protein